MTSMKYTTFEALELEVESLRQQLIAVLAACNMKDEQLNLLLEYAVCSDSLLYGPAAKALAIQPDDSALKQWLGEPVAYCDFPGRLKYVLNGVIRYSSSPEWVSVGDSLYSPKELK